MLSVGCGERNLNIFQRSFIVLSLNVISTLNKFIFYIVGVTHIVIETLLEYVIYLF